MAGATENWCLTATKDVYTECYSHLQWARTEGLDWKPEWYPTGTTDTDADLQCALFMKVDGLSAHNSHNCHKPSCEPISDSMKADAALLPEISTCLPPTTTTTAPPVEKAPVVMAPPPEPKPTDAPEAFPIWGWVLIALGVAALVGGLVALYQMNSKKTKTTRAVKIPVEKQGTPAPPAQTPAPVPTQVEPLATYVAPTQYVTAPVEYVAAPPVVTAVTQAPPVYAAQPVVSQVAPSMVQAAPVYAYAQAAPVQETVLMPQQAVPVQSIVMQQPGFSYA